MPPQVLAAYKDPLMLSDLFGSVAFSPSDRLSIRENLLDELIDEYGSAEVPWGSKYTTIRRRMLPMKKQLWRSIEIMANVPDYGGRDAVLFRLARLMEPQWIRWWSSDQPDVTKWYYTIDSVLGERQMRWICCACARSCVDMAPPDYKDLALKAIESSEAFASNPSERRLDAMEKAGEEAWSAAVGYCRPYRYSAGTGEFAAGRALLAASHSCFSRGSPSPREVIISASSANAGRLRGKNRSKFVFEDQTRLMRVVSTLLTPTLITSASGELR